MLRITSEQATQPNRPSRYQIGRQLIGLLRHDFLVALWVSMFGMLLMSLVFGGLVALVVVVGLLCLTPHAFYFAVKLCVVLRIKGFYFDGSI